MRNEWIGLQFNFDKNVGLKNWIEENRIKGVETDGEHISVEFSKIEFLNQIGNYRKKIDLIKMALENFSKDSDYTNIYYYVNADNLKGAKKSLLEGELEKSIKVEEIIDTSSFIENFKTVLKSKKAIQTIERNNLMDGMDDVLELLANRSFATDQELTLQLDFESKEEWGTEEDNFNISIQLEKEE